MIVAVTLTPVMCSYLLTGDKVLQRSQKELIVSRWLKKFTVRHSNGYWLAKTASVIGSTVALFVASLVVFFSLGRNFLPPFNEGSLTINATMPGISLEESDKIGREVERILLEIPEIQTVARKTGRAELDEHALGVNVSGNGRLRSNPTSVQKTNLRLTRRN